MESVITMTMKEKEPTSQDLNQDQINPSEESILKKFQGSRISDYPDRIKMLKQVGFSCGCRIHITRDKYIQSDLLSIKLGDHVYNIGCIGGTFSELFWEYLNNNEYNTITGSEDFIQILE